MAFEEKAVRTVIEVLHDGERGFKSLSDQLKEPRAKSYFAEESATRGRFATELESALSAGKGDPAEQGEDAAKKAFEEALKVNDIPPAIRMLLQKQQTHIIAAHDKVKALRDSLAAA
jgi:hypothetical protein